MVSQPSNEACPRCGYLHRIAAYYLMSASESQGLAATNAIRPHPECIEAIAAILRGQAEAVEALMPELRPQKVLMALTVSVECDPRDLENIYRSIGNRVGQFTDFYEVSPWRDVEPDPMICDKTHPTLGKQCVVTAPGHNLHHDSIGDAWSTPVVAEFVTCPERESVTGMPCVETKPGHIWHHTADDMNYWNTTGGNRGN